MGKGRRGHRGHSAPRQHGPRDVRYFLASAEKRIIGDLALALYSAFGLDSQCSRDELVQVVSPGRGLDPGASYGIFICPPRALGSVLSDISPYAAQDIKPRASREHLEEMGSSLHLLHPWRVPGSNLAEDLRVVLAGSVPVPYRLGPGAAPLESKLEGVGYRRAWECAYPGTGGRDGAVIGYSIPRNVTGQVVVEKGRPALPPARLS